MLVLLYKALGVLGLLLITYGIFAKNQKQQDIVFALGGIGVLVYSIYLKDAIFITLFVIFTLASLFEAYMIRKKLKTDLPLE